MNMLKFETYSQAKEYFQNVEIEELPSNEIFFLCLAVHAILKNDLQAQKDFDFWKDFILKCEQRAEISVAICDGGNWGGYLYAIDDDALNEFIERAKAEEEYEMVFAVESELQRRQLKLPKEEDIEDFEAVNVSIGEYERLVEENGEFGLGIQSPKVLLILVEKLGPKWKLDEEPAFFIFAEFLLGFVRDLFPKLKLEEKIPNYEDISQRSKERIKSVFSQLPPVTIISYRERLKKLKHSQFLLDLLPKEK